MIQFYYRQAEGRKKLHRCTSTQCSVGSARSNDLTLNSRSVARRHAVLYQEPDGIYLKDLGSTAGSWVNRQRIREHGPLSEFDQISLGDIEIWLDPDTPVRSGLLPQVPDIHSNRVESGIAAESAPPGPDSASNNSEDTPMTEELFYWGAIVHAELIRQLDLYRRDVSSMTDEQLRQESRQILDDVINAPGTQLPDHIDRQILKRNVLNEAVGLGPLEKFLGDESVTEIMVNDHRNIFIERNGQITRSTQRFSSDEAVFAVIDRIISPLGKRIDESSPIVDARLKDGSRVNAVIPPLALRGPSLTIRKFPAQVLGFDEMLAYQSISAEMVSFLRTCVAHRRNIVVSGGTGSGKTTLLNALSGFIPNTERIVTIEDAAELKLQQPNIVSLESRPPNNEGKREVRIRDLVRNALRMRPDRIVVGECRGGEALDMLQAMNTGHDGSLTTVHANSPRDVISRLEVLVLMAGIELPVIAIREQIASAVDIIVQQARFPNGRRRITKITEVVGIESGTIQLQDLFVYQQRLAGEPSQHGRIDAATERGRFSATGEVPTFYEALRESGVPTDLALFQLQEAAL